jgi:hypothetical protein
MKYVLNKKEIEIPDKELDNLVNSLDLTMEEAVATWLCDNDYITDDQVEALSQKAKNNRIMATIHEAKSDKPRAKRTVERKANPDKENLIALFAEALANQGITPNVTNVGKIIEFECNGKMFKLDLIERRMPKEKK